MESIKASGEELPALYRTILDLVDELERCDARSEASRLRAMALATYSSSWDAAHRRRLEHLEHRLRRSIASHGAPARRRIRMP